MALERELKYSSPEGTVPALVDIAAVLRPLGAGVTELGATTHVDVYFDDARRAVQRAGLALRIRTTGARRVATLKSRGSVVDGVHERDELEVPLPPEPATTPAGGAAPRPSGGAPAEWPPAFGAHLPGVELHELTPRMIITTLRHRFTLVQDGAPVAELAFDEVACKPAAEAALRYSIDEVLFHEVELEALSAGGRAPVSAQALARYGAALQELLPLYPSDITKLERAATLLAAFEE